MKSNRNATQNYIFWLLLIPIFLLGITNNVFAASTGEIHLLQTDPALDTLLPEVIISVPMAG